MKTIVEALKDLYVALGGSSSDVSGLSLNPDVIEKMATLVTSGALKELPSLTGNAGKVLTVASGASGVEWKDVPSELPALSGNAGKVLKVDADAEGVEWAEAGGGGGGLTLYGPYIFKNSEALTGLTGWTEISLETLTDYDGQSTYDISNIPTDTKWFLVGITNNDNKSCLATFYLPETYQETVQPPFVDIIPVSSTNIEIGDIKMLVYSTNELTPQT